MKRPPSLSAVAGRLDEADGSGAGQLSGIAAAFRRTALPHVRCRRAASGQPPHESTKYTTVGPPPSSCTG